MAKRKGSSAGRRGDTPKRRSSVGAPPGGPRHVPPAGGSGGPGREGGAPAPEVLDAEIVEPEPAELLTPLEAGDAGLPAFRYDALGAYIREVRKTPPLSREEEQHLARRYREFRDKEAARRLVLANLSLVVKIALMLRRAVANALDLIQEGNLGLLQALEKFDPDIGVRFPTYASWWVKAYILKYLLDNARVVRVGTTNARRKLIYNLQKEKARLDAMGITAGPKLLAEHFGVSEQDVVDVQAALEAGDFALDAPITDGEGGKSRVTLLPDPGASIEEQVARRQLQQLLSDKIARFAATLNERERAILEKRLLAEQPATLQEIGDRFSVTREAVRLTEERLLRRLKEYLRGELGEDLLMQVRR
jgi:RNA polymerase sigma-32 factor